MARKRLTEYTAKNLLYPSLQISLNGTSVQLDSIESDLKNLNSNLKYVVKVDEGVKKRMKKGLVGVNISLQELRNFIIETGKKGYQQFFVEEYIEHSEQDEKFLSLERGRDGIVVHYSNKGGIDVEDNPQEIKKEVVVYPNDKEVEKISNYLGLSSTVLENIFKIFQEYYLSFLEINPLVIKDSNVYILDLAVEVDSTAEFFVKGCWSKEDFIDVFSQKRSDAEKNVAKLASESQAAFSLELLNKNGSLFLLLSGGGASLVIADEAYNLGYGKEVANYGEYSGNPNAEETYIYTKNLLSLLLNSKSKKKVLIIGGGVANFTDVRITFKGIVKALNEVKTELKEQHIGVYVRRGGPHQEEGLEMLQHFIIENKLTGKVHGPDIMLTEVVKEGISSIES